MSAQHTPGPWHVVNGTVYMDADGSKAIARMERNAIHTTPVERDANARLIASAPALLEALEHAYGMHLSVCPACECEQFRPARAAIRAAKGETK